jgi:hypothetical protein
MPKTDTQKHLYVTEKLLEIDLLGKTIKDISLEINENQYYISCAIKRGDIVLQSKKSVDGLKRCGTCKEFKNKSNFGLSSRAHDKLRNRCKQCRKRLNDSNLKDLKEFFEKNKELKKEKDRIYWKKNTEKIKIKRSTPESKAKKAIHDKNYVNKNKCNPSFVVGKSLRSQISSRVKNGVKKNKTIEILGYTINELRSHLESMFTEGMNWNNYGRHGWHIDHVKPLVMFDLSTEDGIKDAWSLSNLQPLWEKENHSKNSIYMGIRRFRSDLQ